MKKFLVAGALVGLIAVVITSTAPAAQKRQNSVVCFNGPAQNGFPTPVYRTTPRKCTFTVRGEKKPFGFASQSFTHLSWDKWGHDRAHGAGKQLISTVGPVPAEVFLYRALDRCGHRTYTKARFVDPNTGHSSKMNLHICAK
jgi:hypothetical protein